jgi:hypothetical protein
MWKALSLMAATDLAGALKRNIRAAAFFAVGAVLALIGVLYIIEAIHIWLAFRIGPVASSLVIAAAMLMLAGILILVGQSARERKTRSVTMSSGAMMAAPFAARLIAKRTGLATVAVAGVVALGAVLGRYIGRE